MAMETGPVLSEGRVLSEDDLDRLAEEVETSDYDVEVLISRRSAANPVRRQHMVSRMLLKRWSAADQQSSKILEVDTVDGSGRLVSPKRAAWSSVYAAADLVTDIEQMWSNLESRAGQVLSGFLDGAPLSVEDESAVRDLMAVHYARSMTVLELAQSLRDNDKTLEFWRTAPDWTLDGIFRDLTGIVAAGPQARRIAQTHIDTTIQKKFSTTFTRNLPNMLRLAQQRFRDATLALARCEGNNPLVISDKPIIVFNMNGDKLEQCEPPLLGTADGAAMPLSPNCLALLFWSESAITETITNRIAKIDHHAFNKMQNRQARRYLYSHPHSDLATWIKTNREPANNRDGDPY